MYIKVIGHHLMDVIPVARDRVVEEMQDGVIVLDADNRIVDVNPAVRHIVEKFDVGRIGRPVGEAFPDVFDALIQSSKLTDEIEFVREGQRQIYEVRLSSLYDRQQRLTSRVLLLHEITTLKVATEAAEAASQTKSDFLANMGHGRFCAKGCTFCQCMFYLSNLRAFSLYIYDGRICTRSQGAGH
jgi:transcriptional regulator with PAS, ATPase and Fis domain